jgi:endonuclease/exonuclease/phosphatase (EEP) superfamily protein YafD
MLLNEWTDSSADKSFFTVPVEAPNRKIDYILYRPAAQWRVKESRPLDEVVASDHRAVLSVLEIIGNPAE